MTSSGCASFRAATEARRGRAQPRGVVWLLAMALSALPAHGESRAAPSGFELTHSVEQTLQRTQELWLQWVGATLQDNLARADEALRSLLGAAHEVGFRRLPDLSLAASAQARESARGGDFDRARRQLAAAEQLDPDRPDVSFAAAAVARAEGDWIGWGSETVRGLLRVWRGPERAHLEVSLGIWVLLVLLVASAAYVLLLAGVHGRRVLFALRARLPDGGFAWIAPLAMLALLVGPALLPGGIFLLLLVWSALLWSFASRSERAMLALGWIVVAAAPLVVDQWQRGLALEESPPIRAIDAFRSGRLYGSMFSDLEVLRTALPSDPAVVELAADVHRTLGQWELACDLYRRVLVDEPGNVPVLLNLGAYNFRKGEYALADGYFQRATRSPDPSAAAWYDLSLGLSESYDFEDSRQALAKAREIDGPGVDAWMATPIPDKILTFNGSLGRTSEIRRALRAAWARGDGGREAGALRQVLPALAVIVALLAALGFDALCRRSPVPAPGRRRGAPAGILRWGRILLPAIGAAEEGRGVPALGNLLLLTLLVLLPAIFELAGALPVVGWPGPRGLALIAAAGATLYLAARLRSGLAGEED